MDAPIIFDEAEWVRLAQEPLIISLTNQRIALHNLSVSAIALSTGLFGYGEWVIRLPTFIAGTALIPFVFWVSHALFDRWTAVVAMAIVSVAWPLVAYSVVGRGYAFGNLFFIAMLALVPFVIDNNNRVGILLLGFLFAIAFYSVQSMVFAYFITIT